jgi:exopolysaccharide biosynthesis protein
MIVACTKIPTTECKPTNSTEVTVATESTIETPTVPTETDSSKEPIHDEIVEIPEITIPLAPIPEETKHEHKYTTSTIEATCTESGYTLKTCEVCNESEKSDIVSALGHTYNVETIEPTIESTGYDLFTCTRCGNSYKDNYKEKLEPKYKEVNETVYANQTVNIRKGPSVNYEKIGSLQYGESIKRIGIGDNGWSKVLYNDETAYMYSDYLQTTKPVSNDYPLIYSDSTCTITITKEWKYNAWCYIAHLEFTDYTRFGSSIAKDNRGSYETTSSAGKRLGAIFCVNGPYNWGELANAYAIIRSGKVYHDIAINGDVAIYNSNTGILENADNLGLKGTLASVALSEGLATDTFRFWNSVLVKNGNNISNPDNYDRAQRTFMGSTGKPGEIYIVVSEGRNADGKSPGLRKYECAKVLLDLGCTYGTMLDGGGSSTMYFNGKVLNAASGNQRSVVDFVYFK